MSEPKTYPKMLYGEGGATMIVNSPEQEQAAGAGWDTAPKDEHRTSAATVPPLQSGQEALIEAVAQRTAEVVLAAMLRSSAPSEKGLPTEAPPATMAAPATGKRAKTAPDPSESGE